ncbi:MAG: hypothetical protein PWP65_162 [Clostridia bacterium]|nr:hypothetical protein [Clostridia bacterium]
MEYKWEEKWPPLSFEGQEIPFAGPVIVKVVVTNTGNTFLVNGKVNADLNLYCSRCLESFIYHLELPFEEQYCSADFWQALPEDLELKDEIRVFTGDTIDLSPAVREALLLALPMKPLCRESCQGLCPGCGKDLNRGNCECHREDGDPRLAALAKLLS